MLFIDRCAWSAALGRAMREAGIEFAAHHDHFAHDAPDASWLSAAADKGWLVVTRDQRIRYRANELAAMRRARLHVFVLGTAVTYPRLGKPQPSHQSNTGTTSSFKHPRACS